MQLKQLNQLLQIQKNQVRIDEKYVNEYKNPYFIEEQKEFSLDQEQNKIEKEKPKSWLGRFKSKARFFRYPSHPPEQATLQQLASKDIQPSDSVQSRGMINRLSQMGKNLWYGASKLSYEEYSDQEELHQYYQDNDDDIDQLKVKDYITISKDKIIKTEAYYFTKLTQVKGYLTINHSFMQFDPIESDENDIDISDIELLKLVNEKVLHINNEYIQSAYQYEYLLQFNLTTLNGMTLRETKAVLHKKGFRREIQPMANIFIKIVNDKVRSVNYLQLLNKNSPGIQLIKFIPNKSEPSEFLTDQQISNLIEELPSMIQGNDWTLVYSLNRDGVSQKTFLEKSKKWKHTILVIQDTNDWAFGAYCTENWHEATKFYGTGENFLFTFKKSNKPIVYRWSGQDDQLQWASDDVIGIGGGVHGRFGIFLQDNFLKGSSQVTTTFENEILSEKEDFICTNLELWGLE
ncbi:UNKNOWN [Stylonychia lemnae]|uniref:TLDc domain-containing protein n=1 Tax=Stylonychia lemnae TaxID=5949 RepID=A0A077ZU53_STYLE|nr:UNKNOWN [Stylonychia lemnae]|eukprot:CDW72815.1 UNKNOWN [Stylonychia lemnae]